MAPHQRAVGPGGGQRLWKAVQAARLNGVRDSPQGARAQLTAITTAAPLTLALPFPPSLNNAFANVGRGRVRSRGYRGWVREAGWVLALARPTPITGPFIARMVFDPPDRRRRDLDNLSKAILDLLVAHGVVADDSLCRKLLLAWSDLAPAGPGGVEITLEAVP
jgi:crossover junction endodeoxyribonuclease RusA